MSFLQLKQVSKSYGARSVLDGVSLSVEEGEFVSIVGTSAAGKTTLLSIAAGLRQPDRGTVTLGGTPMAGFSRTAAFVFQNYSLLPWFSALENVRLAVGSVFPDLTRQRQTIQALRYLEMVGLLKAAEKKPRELSGGMRQRVALARAFAVEPRILFLDEPFGALDALTRATLQQELAQLCACTGRTVTSIMITNSVDEAILLSDRILALSRGPGAALGPAVPVSLARPRNAHGLMHDQDAVRIRAGLIEFLASSAARPVHPGGRAPAPKVSETPAEVEA